MSLQAELIRLGLRLFFRRRARAGISVAARRRQLRGYEHWVGRAPAGTETVAQSLGNVPAIRIARTETQVGHHVLYLHGGGYVAGSSTLYRHITWRFAAAARTKLIAIDYRLAPENLFPAAVNDATEAWRALLAEGVDPRRCAVMGDSAGGGLALALALRLRDEGGPLPAAIVALSPWTDLAMSGQSYRPATDPMLRFEELVQLSRQYLGCADACHPYASPLYGEHRGLPPTLLQVGSDEILRDDSQRMAERMREAGCDVTLEIWPRMPHVWHAFAPAMPEALRAIARVGTFVRHWTA
jgi:acetyl esterase/lipase